MAQFISSFAFILWTIAIIGMYYSNFYSNINHVESTSNYSSYLITLIVLYGIYKISVIVLWLKKIRIGFIWIVWIALFHIFLLSVFYTWFPEVSSSPFLANARVNSPPFFSLKSRLLSHPNPFKFTQREICKLSLLFPILNLQGKM
jgi:glucan phosphoethanolaminetransferase (alkaline phosphatase superfamily)